MRCCAVLQVAADIAAKLRIDPADIIRAPQHRPSLQLGVRVVEAAARDAELLRLLRSPERAAACPPRDSHPQSPVHQAC